MRSDDHDESFETALAQTDALIRSYAQQIVLMADTTQRVLAALDAGGGTVAEPASPGAPDVAAKTPLTTETPAPPNSTPETVGMVLQNAVSMQAMLTTLAQAVCSQCVAHVLQAGQSATTTGSDTAAP